MRYQNEPLSSHYTLKMEPVRYLKRWQSSPTPHSAITQKQNAQNLLCYIWQWVVTNIYFCISVI